MIRLMTAEEYATPRVVDDPKEESARVLATLRHYEAPPPPADLLAALQSASPDVRREMLRSLLGERLNSSELFTVRWSRIIELEADCDPTINEEALVNLLAPLPLTTEETE